MSSSTKMFPATFRGLLEMLSQYCCDEYCIYKYLKSDNGKVYRGLVATSDVRDVDYFNKSFLEENEIEEAEYWRDSLRLYFIIEISDDDLQQLIKEKYIKPLLSDKEVKVQQALGLLLLNDRREYHFVKNTFVNKGGFVI